MTIETKPWDAAELLETPAEIAAYLEDGTTEELLDALNTIARSRGDQPRGALSRVQRQRQSDAGHGVAGNEGTRGEIGGCCLGQN